MSTKSGDCRNMWLLNDMIKEWWILENIVNVFFLYLIEVKKYSSSVVNQSIIWFKFVDKHI